MARMEFSVIVPVFNAAQYVERCVRALLAQTVAAGRYEILMEDSNSTARSADIIEACRVRSGWPPGLHCFLLALQSTGGFRGSH
jgi:glycosyltransferase involved in cell wall biosynthesis